MMIALLSQTCLELNPLREGTFKWALVTPFLIIVTTMNFPSNLIIAESLNKNRLLPTKVKTTHSAFEKIFKSWKKIKSLSFFWIKSNLPHKKKLFFYIKILKNPVP
jgi:hypothetical protein